MGRNFLRSSTRIDLGSLLFNIFLSDLFLTIEGNYFSSYAYDTTPYVIDNNAEEVVSELKAITQKLFTWFAQNEMKVNLNKCHLFLSTTDAFNFEISEAAWKYNSTRNTISFSVSKIYFIF